MFERLARRPRLMHRDWHRREEADRDARIRKNMTMNATTILGIALIMLGVVAFAYQGITYTTHEKVIDPGPLQATVDRKQTIPLTPLVGGLALAGGIGLLVVGARRA
jgi:hypothetical protein